MKKKSNSLEKINNNASFGQIRNQIIHLVEKGTDSKLIRYSTEEAIKYLEAAEKLYSTNPECFEPWPSVVAYRKAHLIMRICNSQKKHIRLLKEADRLFAKASRKSSLLGPLPSIYRLAVLHRLQLLSGDDLKDTLSRAYENAISKLSTWTSSSSAAISVFQKKLPQKDNEEIMKLQIQNGYFNMLELASYFLSQPYDQLEGRGLLEYNQEDFFKNSNWIVISPDPETQEIQIPKKIAIAEIEEMGRKNLNSVLFILSHDNSKEKICKWKYGNNDWKKGQYGNLRLLALLLFMRKGTINELKNQFSSGPDERFRTTKKRLKSAFCNLTGLSDEKVFTATETSSGIPILCDEILIFGAVEKRALGYR